MVTTNQKLKSFPGKFLFGTRAHVWKKTCTRVYQPAALPSVHRSRVRRAPFVSSGSLRAGPSSHSLIKGVHVDSGQRWGRAWSPLQDPSARGVRTFSQDPPFMVFRRLIMKIAAAGPRRSSRRNNPPFFWCHVEPPLDWLDRNRLASRQAASAFPRRRFLAICRPLQHPLLTVDPPVPSATKIFHRFCPRLLIMIVSKRIYARKNRLDSPSGRSYYRCTDIMISKTLRTKLHGSC
jgi:hypothetical protein